MNVVAVDLGGTKTTAGLVTLDGQRAEVHHVRTAPTPATQGADAVLAHTARLVTEVMAQQEAAGGPAPQGVAVGSAGVIDPERAVVVAATQGIRGWSGTRLGTRLGQACGLPVHALNDVHAHAVGEAVYGRGRARRSMLLVAAGTGIGGSFVLDGEPWFGSRFAAGHLGHVPVPEAAGLPCPCGRVGHVEALASGPGLHAAYLRAGGRFVDAADAAAVARRAEAGEVLAADVVRLAGTALGRAVGGLANTLDPQIVVVCGGLCGAGPTWWDALRRAVRAEAMDVLADLEVLQATYGDHAALVGAAEFARRKQ